MSNDPAANMARLLALCDGLCETESATVDRRQLCEWLSAMRAQAHDIERLTRERDETLDLMRKHYDDHQRATRLLDEWIVRAHTAEAERDALREAQSTALSLLDEIIRDCNNTGLPNEIVADRVIERVEGWTMEARAALGGQP